MHHDDLARANDLPHGTPTHLGQAIPALVRYHRDRLPAARLTIRATDGQHWIFGDSADPPASISPRPLISSDGSPAGHPGSPWTSPPTLLLPTDCTRSSARFSPHERTTPCG